MNFLQKPVGVTYDGESILNHFKKTTLFNEIQTYEVVKCNNGWWKIVTMTIGGYVHHTDALYHFEYGECDLVVISPTISFKDSLGLYEDTKYSRDFEYPFDKVVLFDEPVNECEIANYLEKRYSTTGISVEKKYDNKILIMQEDDNPAREWNECAYHDFCIAEVKNGMIEMIILSPSPEIVEYYGFYQTQIEEEF